MPTAAFHFPKGFLWGTATAAHQVEGNNTNNNWWKWEQEGHTADKSGLACDWWSGRWKEDFDRAARPVKMHTAFRWNGAGSSRRRIAGMRMPWSTIAASCAACATGI